MKIKIVILICFNCFLQHLCAQVLEKTIEKINNLKNVRYKVRLYDLWGVQETTDTIDSYIKLVPEEKTIGGFFKIAMNYSTELYDGNKIVTLFKDSAYQVGSYDGEGAQYERSLLLYWAKTFAKYLKSPQRITYLADTVINTKKYFHLLYQKDTIINDRNNSNSCDITIDKVLFLPYTVKDEHHTYDGDLPIELTDKYSYYYYKLNQKNFPDLSIINIPSYFITADEKYRKRKEFEDTLSLLDGTKAPGFELKDVDNKSVKLSELVKNSPVLIEFTFIGCGNCYAAIPALKRIREKYSKSDLEMVSIYHTESSTKKNVLNLIKKYDLHAFTDLLNGDDVAKQYHIQGDPIFYIVDRNGNIAWYRLGFSEDVEKLMSDKIDEILRQ